jgi:dihydrodipicolinate synthase/N-acetylneuraminate lyase
MNLDDLPHLHGALALPVTVFRSDGEIDWEQTRRGIAFCLDCGATAICYACGIGEFRALSEAERKKGLEVAVDVVNGRVPVVAGGSGASTELAIMYHKHAKANGAACCMTLPPAMGPRASEQFAYDHFVRLAEAVDMPIMLHNIPAPFSYPMSAELCIRLMEEVELANYIKEEAVDPLQTVARIREANPRYLKSLLTSDGGIHEVDDAMRGADGTIVAPEIVDCHVQTWEAIERGDWERAWALYRDYLPLVYFVEVRRNIGGCKQVLVRRGAIESTHCRVKGWGEFTDHDHRALDALLELISPMFRVPMPAA